MTAATNLPAPSGGAPPGNENRVRHGVYSWAAAGKVPTSIKGGAHLRSMLRALQAGLLTEVERFKDRPATLYEQAVITSAVRHEGRARLLEKLLAEAWGKMTTVERVAVLKEIGSASDSRDKALKAVGLDERREPKTVFPWDLPAALQAGPPAAADAQNRPGGHPEQSEASTEPVDAGI